MADPIGYITAKIASMIGGFFGGSAILTFIRPKTIGEAFTRGGVSVGSSIIFATPILKQLGYTSDWESQALMGFCIGFIAYSVLGMVANFLAKNQNKDIVEVATDLKNSAINSKDKK